MPIAAGPYKPWEETVVGDYVQRNYNFLDRMFGEGKGLGATRNRYLHYTGPQLRQHIKNDLHIQLPDPVKVGVFDCETAAFHDPDHIVYGNDAYYILVLPPTPRGYSPNPPPATPPSQDHTGDQAWDSAWYHAVVDGYGM
jgi:hypothetical protein